MQHNAHDPFDPTSTQLRPLAEYRDRLPSRRRGRKLNRATLWRWALRGARNGRIRLHTVCVGGGRFTSDTDVQAFIRALAEHDRRSGTDTGDGLAKDDDDDAQRQRRASEIATRWRE